MKLQPASIRWISTVSKTLDEMGLDAVFVGGATLPFYIPELYWPRTRPTNDVDVVLSILTRQAATKIEKILLKNGFANVIGEDIPICRFEYQGILVDILSTHGEAMNMTNRWYLEGFERAKSVQIAESKDVKILTVPYFIATKLVAFYDRGDGDYQASKDMEDIISLLDVCSTQDFENELEYCSKDLKSYLKGEFHKLIEKDRFIQAIPGAVFERQQAQARALKVQQRIQDFLAS